MFEMLASSGRDCAGLLFRRAMGGKTDNRFAVADCTESASFAIGVVAICRGANDDSAIIWSRDFLGTVNSVGQYDDDGTDIERS
jgi:hypothetical protein